MYVRVFAQILDSTIAEDWQVRHIFEDLLKIADYRTGIVDMTPASIARRLNAPLDVVNHALEKLSQPDPYSRSQEEEGRRIVLLDSHRNWGWRIVNFLHYRNIRDMDEKREADRERQERHREKKRAVTPVTPRHTQSHKVAHVDVDVEEDSDKKDKQKPSCAALVPIAARQEADIISIPLCDGSEFWISKADVDQWSELFPAVDVIQQLRAYKAWAFAKPKKRKTRRGIKASITSWLSDKQDKGGKVNTNEHFESKNDRIVREALAEFNNCPIGNDGGSAPGYFTR